MLEKEVINFEKTAIVGIVTQNQSEEKLREYLDELEFLTFTAGGKVVKRFSQKMERPNPKTFVGTGKIEEIHQFVKENDISTLIFDDELSPSQQKNISKIIEECKILDRTHLILGYFCATCRNFLCKNASRISTMPIFITKTFRNVDSP